MKSLSNRLKSNDADLLRNEVRDCVWRKQETRLLNEEKKTISDAEETDGASQRDIPHPRRPYSEEMFAIVGSKNISWLFR